MKRLVVGLVIAVAAVLLVPGTGLVTPAQEAMPWMRVDIIEVLPREMEQFIEVQSRDVNRAMQQAGVPWRSAWRTAEFGNLYEWMFVTPMEGSVRSRSRRSAGAHPRSTGPGAHRRARAPHHLRSSELRAALPPRVERRGRERGQPLAGLDHDARGGPGTPRRLAGLHAAGASAVPRKQRGVRQCTSATWDRERRCGSSSRTTRASPSSSAPPSCSSPSAIGPAQPRPGWPAWSSRWNATVLRYDARMSYSGRGNVTPGRPVPVGIPRGDARSATTDAVA